MNLRALVLLFVALNSKKYFIFFVLLLSIYENWAA